MVKQRYLSPVLSYPDRADLRFIFVLDVRFSFMIQVSDSGHLIPEPDTRGPGLECPYSYKSLNYKHLILSLTLAR